MRTLDAVRLLAKVLVAAALVGIGVVMLSLGSEPGPGRPDVAVPWLVGAKLGEAAANLQDLGFCVGVEPGEAGGALAELIEQHPRRYVVDQIPAAGDTAPERTLVVLRTETRHETSRVLYQVAQTNRAMTCPAGAGVGDANA
jgi:beta-lactam-binding protein with PASTA domain